MSDFGGSSKENIIRVAQHQPTDSADTSPVSWFDIEHVAAPLVTQIGGNHDGSVTRRELATALQSPQFSGQQEQVLAGLYGNFAEISKLGGGDGSSISSADLNLLGHKLYVSEKNLSTLVNLESWTKAHFAQLDREHKGYIDVNDVQTAQRTAVGTDAAMLNLLGPNLGKFSADSKLTPDGLSQYVNNYYTHDFKLAASMEHIIARTSQAESSSVSHELVANPNQLSDKTEGIGVHQGFIQDCNFDAPLASLAQQRPNDVTSMITKNDADGTYDVRFPGADHAVNVSAPTAAEQGLYNGPSKTGFWSSLLEKAYGKLVMDDAPNLKKSGLLPQEILDQKTPMQIAIENLTGHEAEDKVLLYTNTSDLVTILNNSLNGGNHKVVTVGSGGPLQEGTTRDGFPVNHGFSVLSFQPGTEGGGTVQIRDSYGVGGPKNDGVTTITVQQLKDNFYDLVYER